MAEEASKRGDSPLPLKTELSSVLAEGAASSGAGFARLSPPPTESPRGCSLSPGADSEALSETSKTAVSLRDHAAAEADAAALALARKPSSSAAASPVAEDTWLRGPDDKEVSRERLVSFSDGTSSVALDVEALSRTCYSRMPLGTFEIPLTHMKFREFIRCHHGVFGTCTLSGTVSWMVAAEFLIVIAALMSCPDYEPLDARPKPFVDPSTAWGGVSIYAFCSVPLTWLLALKFAGPAMHSVSQRLSKLVVVAMTCLALSVQISETIEGVDMCREGHSMAGVRSRGVLLGNLLYTQLQLVLFVVSAFNTLWWPRLYQWFFTHRTIKLWYLAKKQKIRLEIPEAVKRAVDGSGPQGRKSTGGAEASSTLPPTRGMYIEAHGQSLSEVLRVWLFSLFCKKRLAERAAQPVSVVFYVGQVDQDDIPHGFGRWQSGAYHGESIVGYWDRGRPVGPFKSREFGTGSGFQCIRIAWCSAKKGPFRFETQFGVSDAECCVSGAFFRTFPRVTLYSLTAMQKLASLKEQLVHFAGEIVGDAKPTAVQARLSNFGPGLACLPHSDSSDVADSGSPRASWQGACADYARPGDPMEGTSQTRRLSAPLAWQASRLHGAMKRRAHFLFKRRTDQQLNDFDKREALRRNQGLVLERMDPHLPNFGVTDKTELHITVDAEQGLYVAGWVPANQILSVEDKNFPLLSVEPQGARGKRVEDCQDTPSRASQSPVAASPAASDAGSNWCERKASLSQLKAKDLHQKLGKALRQNIRQLDFKQPFKSHKDPTGNAVQDRIVFERRRIRRQTCDSSAKTMIVRIHEGVPPQGQAKTGNEETKNSPAPGARRGGGGGVGPSPDVFDVSVDPARPFAVALSRPELRIDNWRRAEDVGLPEAMVFIHGYNTNHVQSLQIMAQMAAFGNFPSYIKPFLFTWPAGQNFLEFFDARDNARNPSLHDAFKDFMLSLKDNGIRQVHIIAHSLGSRVLIQSLHKIVADEDIFIKVLDLEGNDAPGLHFLRDEINHKMHLVSLNFMNPEFYLDDFVTQEYAFLRQYCSNISIFCDAHDGALWWSELFSGKQALGRSVFGLYTRPSGSEEDAADLRRPPLYASSTACFQGYEPQHMQADNREWLDVDVIDMTWLGSNVHALRHSYWALNREVIEDLRELIVSRKRARQRTSRLDRREGNVWVYRVAPSSLTSIFDSDI